MKIIRTVGDLRKYVVDAHDSGKSIGLVPTMGALHAGHMSLKHKARTENYVGVASVFVNPTQFKKAQDLKTYPRTESADVALLEDAGVDAAFIPSVEEVYPEPDTRVFDLGKVAEVMEGKMRPGHFNGVAQIVSKLFGWVSPDRAYFGEKDFQQIAVIKKMVQLEGFDIEIVDCPICRHDDGLAMSSRNVRLTEEQRSIAPKIHKVLTDSLKWAEEHSPQEVKQMVADTLNGVEWLETEYYEIVDSLSMQPIEKWEDVDKKSGAVAVGCVTVYCGDVRLIDNIKYVNK